MSIVKQFRSAWMAVLFLVSGLVFPRAVEAAAGSRLVYGRAVGSVVCPGESELRAAVRARLGYDPFFPWADQTIVVHLASRPNRRLSGKVYLVDSQGRASPEREFTASVEECGELVQTLALAITMTLEPLHGSTTPPVQSPPSGGAPATPDGPTRESGPSNGTKGSGDIAAVGAAVANAARASTDSLSSNDAEKARGIAPPTTTPAGADKDAKPPSTAQRIVHLDIGAGAIGSIGTLPGISAGFVPFLRPRWSDVSVALEGRFELLALNGASGDRASASLGGAALVPCLHLGDLLGCAAFLLARYRAEGVDAVPTEATALFAAAGIRVGAEIPVASGARGFVRGEGLVNLTRHDIALAGESLWRIPPASFTLNIGALVSIL